MTESPLRMDMESFAAAVGDEFEIIDEALGATVTALTLEEATPLRNASPARPEPFSLIFRGPDSPGLCQGTYVFRHPSIGALPIFIVPIAERDSRRTYQAIFN